MTATPVSVNPAMAEPVLEEHVALRKLAWVAPLLLLASLIANSVIRAVALALNANSGQFMPVAGPTYLVLTTAGVLGAVLAFVAVARFARRPFTWYRRVALVVLPLSFVPDLALLFAPSSDASVMLGTPDAFSVGALMLMHIVTAVLCIVLLTRLTRPSPIGRG